MITFSGILHHQPTLFASARAAKSSNQPILFGSQTPETRSVRLMQWDEKALIKLPDLLALHGLLTKDEYVRYRQELKTLGKESRSGKHPLSPNTMAQLKGFLKVTLDRLETAGFITQHPRKTFETSEYEEMQHSIHTLPGNAAQSLMNYMTRWNPWFIKNTLKLYEALCKNDLLSDAEKTQYAGLMKKLKQLRKHSLPAQDIPEAKAFIWLGLRKMNEHGLVNREVNESNGLSEAQLLLKDFEQSPAHLPKQLCWFISARTEALKAWPNASSERQKNKILNRMRRVEEGLTGLSRVFDALDPKLFSTAGSCNLNLGEICPPWTPDKVEQFKKWTA